MMRVSQWVPLLFLSAPTVAQDLSIDQQVAVHRMAIEDNRDASVLCDAILELNRLSRHPQATAAVSALMEVIKNNPEGETRGLAIEAVAHIKLHRNEPCPLLLVESVFSNDENVRNYASVYTKLFAEFEPGAIDALLPHLDVDDPFRRGDALMWLAIAGKKSPTILQLLHRFTNDSHFYVRHCAHCAVYQITKKLGDILPYCLEIVARTTELPANTPKEVRLAQTQKNLINTAMLGRLMDLVAKNPSELEQELARLLDDEAPQVRLNTLVALGNAIQANANAPLAIRLPRISFTGEDDPVSDETKSALESMQENFLKSDWIEARFRRMALDDPDEKVRAGAARTLAIMTEALNKEPPARQSRIETFLTPSSPDDSPLPPGGGFQLPRDLNEKFRDGTSNTIFIGE